MAHTSSKPGLTHKTVHIGSSFAAGAMMLSRMNRSEVSRYDDLMADLSRLRTPAPVPLEATQPKPVDVNTRKSRWTRWISR
jgi:hypothetical protein